MSTIDNVFVFKNKLKKQLLLENQNLKDTFLLDASINQAIFEVMKRIFDNEMKKTEKSMEKAFFGDIASNEKDSTYDNEKQKMKRTMKFIEEARYDEGKEFERISGFLPDDFKQLKRKTDSTKSNFESNHYNITDQNKKEISNINKLKIIKSIRNNRIQDVKKVANSKFESLYREYDSYCYNEIESVLKDDVSPEEYLSVVFELFNIEDKCSLEIVYNIANYFVNNNIDDTKFERAEWLYISYILSPNGASCMNRSVFLKKLFMPYFFDTDEDEFQIYLNCYLEYIEIVFILKNFLIKDESLIRIPKKEWIDFIKSDYNLLDEFKRNKEWTPKKIRIARRVFENWNRP